MENKPLFSVLIANYNNGKYLQEAVDSVKNQTYENWEIVIVDDGSTDNSFEIYNSLITDPRIRVFNNEKNIGVGFTKRKLVELSYGEYFGFLDADDALLENSIERVLLEFKKNDYALIYSKMFICDNKLNIIRISQFQMQIPEGETYLAHTLGRVSQFATINRKYYDKTSGINDFFLMGEDQDLYFKLEEVGKIKHLEEPLYKCRRNTISTSTKNPAETIAWGVFAKYEAAKRRRLNPAIYVSNIIRGENEITKFYESSTDYKIGNKLLKPFRYIKYKLYNNDKKGSASYSPQ